MYKAIIQTNIYSMFFLTVFVFWIVSQLTSTLYLNHACTHLWMLSVSHSFVFPMTHAKSSLLYIQCPSAAGHRSLRQDALKANIIQVSITPPPTSTQEFDSQHVDSHRYAWLKSCGTLWTGYLWNSWSKEISQNCGTRMGTCDRFDP